MPGKRSNEALDLSGVLQSLPIHAGNVRAARFRNPEGVALKLANFRAVERDVAINYGVAGADALLGGMSAYSQQDRAVYEEFYGRWDLLHEEATAIRRIANMLPAMRTLIQRVGSGGCRWNHSTVRCSSRRALLEGSGLAQKRHSSRHMRIT